MPTFLKGSIDEEVLSMYVDGVCDSLFRIRRGSRIVYVIIGHGVFSQDDLEFPVGLLSKLRTQSVWRDNWTTIHIWGEAGQFRYECVRDQSGSGSLREAMQHLGIGMAFRLGHTIGEVLPTKP
jgi:hypothetical protein